MRFISEKGHIPGHRAFTLMEVSIAALVFIISLVSILFVFINSSRFTDLSFELTKGMFSAQTVAEAYKNYTFANISSQCPDFCTSCTGTCKECGQAPVRYCSFSPEGYAAGEASGTAYICKQNNRNDLLRLNVVICFRQGQRVVGEDLNLNGILDSGEDTDGNGLIDSPVEVTRLFTGY